MIIIGVWLPDENELPRPTGRHTYDYCNTKQGFKTSKLQRVTCTHYCNVFIIITSLFMFITITSYNPYGFLSKYRLVKRGTWFIRPRIFFRACVRKNRNDAKRRNELCVPILLSKQSVSRNKKSRLANIFTNSVRHKFIYFPRGLLLLPPPPPPPLPPRPDGAPRPLEAPKEPDDKDTKKMRYHIILLNRSWIKL